MPRYSPATTAFRRKEQDRGRKANARANLSATQGHKKPALTTRERKAKSRAKMKAEQKVHRQVPDTPSLPVSNHPQEPLSRHSSHQPAGTPDHSSPVEPGPQTANNANLADLNDPPIDADEPSASIMHHQASSPTVPSDFQPIPAPQLSSDASSQTTHTPIHSPSREMDIDSDHAYSENGLSFDTDPGLSSPSSDVHIPLNNTPLVLLTTPEVFFPGNPPQAHSDLIWQQLAEVFRFDCDCSKCLTGNEICTER